ncbi:TIGR00725 family protein [Kitasatospora sp. DSM 101779]|uniref:TIGR00725 family protein n=1 Tax=Kitasatospora sp. DSM 101779 TaxID=2853165 RepID=UPI0021DA6EF7|nr:TIGR00725 family protein [Kitasatospora sp. DSM 101779]MCU7826578.1 TIGR00725 family protein [Kitasatospora sp. DSM 101779]
MTSALPPTAGAPHIGVIGPGGANPEESALARRVGELLAGHGAVLLCGGLGGVMEAAAAGARSRGGITVGLLPGPDRTRGNPHLTVALATGLGELRNGLLVRACDALIAVGGSWGTLSEVALAVRVGKPVVSLAGWSLPDAPADAGLVRAATPEEAVAAVLSGRHGRVGGRPPQ